MLVLASREDFLHRFILRIEPNLLGGHKEHSSSNQFIRVLGILRDHTHEHAVSDMQFSMSYDVQLVLDVVLKIIPQLHREVVAQLFANRIDDAVHILVCGLFHVNILLLPIHLWAINYLLHKCSIL